MSDEPPQTYIISIGKDDTKSSGEYYEIPIPDKIKELEPLEPILAELKELEERGVTGQELGNAKSDAFFPELVRPDDEPPYIQVHLQEHGRLGRVLKNEGNMDEPDFRMTFPKEFLDGDDTPFDGFDNSSIIKLEIDVERDGMRIYREKDYPERDQRLAAQGRKPVIKKYPLVLLGAGRSRDKAPDNSGDDEKQTFKIVPFDITHRTFTKEAEEPIDGESFEPGLEKIQNVIEAGRMPRRIVQRLEIRWDPEGNLVEYRSDRSQLIQSQEYTDRIWGDLPKKGRFHISTHTKYGSRTAPLVCRQTSNDEIVLWNAHLGAILEHEDHYIMYVPCRTR